MERISSLVHGRGSILSRLRGELLILKSYIKHPASAIYKRKTRTVVEAKSDSRTVQPIEWEMANPAGTSTRPGSSRWHACCLSSEITAGRRHGDCLAPPLVNEAGDQSGPAGLVTGA